MCLNHVTSSSHRHHQPIPSPPTHSFIINSSCVADVCTVGHFYNTSSRRCEPCGTGHYQPDTGQTSCFSCAIGKTTRTLTATKATECFGEWRIQSVLLSPLVTQQANVMIIPLPLMLFYSYYMISMYVNV